MLYDSQPARRLLVQGVLASTNQLVRGLAEGRPRAALRKLMQERRRMLGELRAGYGPEDRESLRALAAAMAESDRTMEAMLA